MRAEKVPFVAVALALAACGGQGQEQVQDQPQRRVQQQTRASGAEAGVTPMAERVAVIGLLNKRNGIVRNLTMKPGQSLRVKDAIIRLRACEQTAPWEQQQLTGAFVQLDVQRPDKQWARAFSGWMYKESPSLNVVEHPVYDVWPKSCAMTFPGGIPVPDAPGASSNASSANRSGASPAPRSAPPPAPAPPEPSAAVSNAT